MRILVCGGRNFYKYDLLKETLNGILDDGWAYNEDVVFTIIQGGASGADFLAKVFVLDWWGNDSQVKLEEYPADWKTYGRAAGAIRNQKMLDEGKPDLVVAFEGGSGTRDMVERATKAGVKVVEVK